MLARNYNCFFYSVRQKMNWAKITVQQSHYACNVSLGQKVEFRVLFYVFSLWIFIIVITFRTDAPRCKPGTEQSAVGSINMHSIDVRCEVDALPSENIRFSWTYNNTRNVSPVCPIVMHAKSIVVSSSHFSFVF